MRNILIFLAVLAVIGLWLKSTYNGFVPAEENVKNKWADVQNVYQRRADLIPNLVNTVKGAANFEQKTLTDVIDARAKATSIKLDAKDLTPEKLAEFQQAQQGLSGALGRLMMITENYPQLKANQNFIDLQTQLEGTENRVTVARKDYNESVASYNNTVRRFPANVIAGLFKFGVKPPFEADAASQKAPEVDFESKK
jgi:LemA protein